VVEREGFDRRRAVMTALRGHDSVARVLQNAIHREAHQVVVIDDEPCDVAPGCYRALPTYLFVPRVRSPVARSRGVRRA
jgi:hypothetical protein